MRVLERDEILEILVRNPVGHIGLVDTKGPYVVPIGFVWFVEAMWFYSGPGRKSRALAQNPEVALEVCEWEPASGCYRSVVVLGHARRARSEEASAAWEALLVKYGSDGRSRKAKSDAAMPVPQRLPRGFDVWCVPPREMTGRVSTVPLPAPPFWPEKGKR